MSKAAFDAKLAAVEALKDAEGGPKRDSALAKALADRNNYVVAKAAQVVAEVRATGLIPKLIETFERFMIDPVKTDPQCWAKVAAVKALARLEHDAPEVYIAGMRHVQLEAVWGGQEDMAGPLRANSTFALVQCRSMSDLDLLELLIEPLLDPDKTVRVEAARAIGRIERREAAIVLRLRALSGDSEPEPLGAVYSALLGVEGEQAIAFVGRFLQGKGDAAQEAALALGCTHSASAFDLLRSAVGRCKDPELRRTLLAAIALTRRSEAFDFLVAEVERASKPALQALEAMPLSDSQQARLSEAIARGGVSL